MKQKALRAIAPTSLALVVMLAAAWPAQTHAAKTPSPGMGPLDQYLLGRNPEVTLGRSASPGITSAACEVLHP